MTDENFEKLKEKALELLEPFERRYYPTLSDVHWVRQDDHDTDGDYCEKCIDKAVKNARKELREARKKVLDKFKEIEETGKFNGQIIKGKYTDAEIKKAKRYELEQLGISKFGSAYNHGGGYEHDSFLTCDICGQELNISILPNEDNIQYVIDDLDTGIDNQTSYHAYCLIYNEWGDSENYSAERNLTLELAKRVIELLS